MTTPSNKQEPYNESFEQQVWLALGYTYAQIVDGMQAATDDYDKVRAILAAHEAEVTKARREGIIAAYTNALNITSYLVQLNAEEAE